MLSIIRIPTMIESFEILIPHQSARSCTVQVAHICEHIQKIFLRTIHPKELKMKV